MSGSTTRGLVFRIKSLLGIWNRQTPLQSWSSIDPRASTDQPYASIWRAKAPALPLSLLPREYLAPWLELYALESGHSAVDEAEGIVAGKFRITADKFISVGFPPVWNQGLEVEARLHWSKISPRLSETKEQAWQLSRFSWSLALVRAWILDGNPKHAENFWRLFEDWMEKNPPNQGPQWVVEEEVARRLIMVSYVVQALPQHSASTDERIEKVARFVEVSAERLRATLGDFNHQPSIAGLYVKAALYTAGALWPRLTLSDVWRSDGLESTLAHLAQCLGDDGQMAFSDTDSEDEALQLITWIEIVLRSEKETLPEIHQKKITALINRALLARDTIELGSELFLFKATTSGVDRPSLQAAQILFTGVRSASSPADEASLLLSGPLCASAN